MSLGRARPILLFQKQFYGFYGFHFDHNFWSFPSGHATTIMGLSFGLSILFPRYVKYFMLLGILVMTTRVILTQHFLSDVLIAAYLCLIEVGIIYYLISRYTSVKK